MFSSLPGLLISLALSAFLPHQWIAFALACALILLPYLIRFFQSLQSKVTQSMPYRAAWALGATPPYLFQRYLIPELMTGLRSIWPSLMARLVLIETSFSFLGIAPKSGVDTWGRLLYQGRDFLLEAPWMIASVALPLFFTLLSFHLLTESEQS
jgi:peptide/nickel transport system permease protein